MFGSVIVKRKFTAAEEWAMEMCPVWNFTSSLPKIAMDLMDHGPEWGTVQWNEVGSVFVKFFGSPNSLSCRASRDWEIIGDMVREFSKFYKTARKDVVDV